MKSIGYLNQASSTDAPQSFEDVPFRVDLKFLKNWQKLSSRAALRFLCVALSLAVVGVAGETLAAQRGNSGSQVSSVQRCLKQLGYFNGPVNGNFGPQTETAVKRFQRANGLPTVGNVGPQTQGLLRQRCEARSSRSSSSSGLKFGSRGPAVSRLQRNLSQLGYFNAPISGYFGEETRRGVIRFQQAYGLRADGVVGSATLNAISANPRNPGSFTGQGGENDSLPNALNQGDRNESVRELQTALQRLNYFQSNPTGYFGDATRNAVARFQRDYGLRVSGIADDQTLVEISRAVRSGPINTGGNFGNTGGNFGNTGGNFGNNSGESACSAISGDICLGEEGQRVTLVQQRLQQLGFFRGNITNYFGSATRDAVIQFQRSSQLNATGIVDFSTWQALRLGGGISSPPSTNNQSQDSYVVIIPITNRDTLFRVRQYIPNAFASESRLGDYVNAGSYRDREEAERLSRQLRQAGFDARVEYF
ncbi:MAG: peptidoglycan-binding protein [Scytonematopsis contorta HA4267-MV1]|jgi:peptidoglycan hydrolase-like protein with peptidoglycan-binding domain|nr:peptidoglycan-binding protein [Scytonematopsis contorta HA4267-MV1]